MWYITVKGLSEPVMIDSLAFIKVGHPILIEGKLYEVVSIYKR